MSRHKFTAPFHKDKKSWLSKMNFTDVLTFCSLSLSDKFCDKKFWNKYIIKNINTDRLSFENLILATQLNEFESLQDAIKEEGIKAAITYLLEGASPKTWDEMNIHDSRLFPARKIVMQCSSEYDNVLDKLFTTLNVEPLDDEENKTKASKAFYTLQRIHFLVYSPFTQVGMTSKEKEIYGKIVEYKEKTKKRI